MSLLCFIFLFFFKQKTAYERRISDWSSDVCSSDLDVRTLHRRIESGQGASGATQHDEILRHRTEQAPLRIDDGGWRIGRARMGKRGLVGGSEERRVGKAGVSTCRCRWTQ